MKYVISIIVLLLLVVAPMSTKASENVHYNQSISTSEQGMSYAEKAGRIPTSFYPTDDPYAQYNEAQSCSYNDSYYHLTLAVELRMFDPGYVISTSTSAYNDQSKADVYDNVAGTHYDSAWSAVSATAQASADFDILYEKYQVVDYK